MAATRETLQGALAEHLAILDAIEKRDGETGGSAYGRAYREMAAYFVDQLFALTDCRLRRSNSATPQAAQENAVESNPESPSAHDRLVRRRPEPNEHRLVERIAHHQPMAPFPGSRLAGSHQRACESPASSALLLASRGPWAKAASDREQIRTVIARLAMNIRRARVIGRFAIIEPEWIRKPRVGLGEHDEIAARSWFKPISARSSPA